MKGDGDVNQGKNLEVDGHNNKILRNKFNQGG